MARYSSKMIGIRSEEVHDSYARKQKEMIRERIGIWCGVHKLGDSGVHKLCDTSAFVNPAGQLLLIAINRIGD